MGKIAILLIFLIIAFPANSHVEHYKDLNLIEFDIYRNDKYIGKHTVSFSKTEKNILVKSKIEFKIKAFKITIYDYKSEGTEVYKNGKLIKFNSKTEQNKKTKYVNLELEGEKYIINGSSYNGYASQDFSVGTWWNHNLIASKAQISAVSGRIIKQKVTFIGKETIKIGNKNYKALHFNFSSIDQKLNKNKRLNTDVWYDEKNLNWIKASFNKKGKWEYKLIKIE